jgi:hypothetical protein
MVPPACRVWQPSVARFARGLAKCHLSRNIMQIERKRIMMRQLRLAPKISDWPEPCTARPTKPVAPIVICVFLLSSCLNPFNSSEPPNIAGNWTLSVTSSKFGNQITATGTIAQNGSHISGSFSLAADPCADSAEMSERSTEILST